MLRQDLIDYAMSHLSDLIPYDDPEYDKHLRELAEQYADHEINRKE